MPSSALAGHADPPGRQDFTTFPEKPPTSAPGVGALPHAAWKHHRVLDVLSPCSEWICSSSP
eukprot:8307281-Pyramimonas_sp.AAC.1